MASPIPRLNTSLTAGFLACLTTLGTSGCKTKKQSASPKDGTTPTSTADEADSPLKKLLKREAIEQLRPFSLKSGGLKAQAHMFKAPTVKQADSGSWTITGEYAPDNSTSECVLLPRIESFGFHFGLFVELALDSSEKISKYELVGTDLFFRKSKYASAVQLVRYGFAGKQDTIGFFTIISTHGDGWTLTCAADAPGYFDTFLEATKRLADSITIQPNQNIPIPSTYFAYTTEFEGKTVGIQELFIYAQNGGVINEQSLSIMAFNKPEGTIKLDTRHEIKTFENNKIQSGWVNRRINGKSDSEYTYTPSQDPTRFTVINELSKDKVNLTTKSEFPLWTQEQTRSCLQKIFTEKNKSSCEYGLVGLLEKGFRFETMKTVVKDKARRISQTTFGPAESIEWYDDRFHGERNQINIRAAGRKVSMTAKRIWPPVDAKKAAKTPR